MIRRPPRSTLDRSSAASDVYKRQVFGGHLVAQQGELGDEFVGEDAGPRGDDLPELDVGAVSYTHLRAHETVLDIVCRLLLEKTKNLNAAM